MLASIPADALMRTYEQILFRNIKKLAMHDEISGSYCNIVGTFIDMNAARALNGNSRSGCGDMQEDFFEIDFLPVHTSKSGDAIPLRYSLGGQVYVHLVDGGYQSTAAAVSDHLTGIYETTTIDHVVVTHPDQDHAEGLAPILEHFNVRALWMFRPWQAPT